MKAIRHKISKKINEQILDKSYNFLEIKVKCDEKWTKK